MFLFSVYIMFACIVCHFFLSIFTIADLSNCHCVCLFACLSSSCLSVFISCTLSSWLSMNISIYLPTDLSLLLSFHCILILSLSAQFTLLHHKIQRYNKYTYLLTYLLRPAPVGAQAINNSPPAHSILGCITCSLPA